MEKKKLYTYTAISLAVSTILIYLIVKMKGKGGNIGEKDTPSTDYTKEDYKDYIVTTPNGKKSVNVVIVYGGINYANPKWMFEQMPKEILLRNLIFIAPYTNSASKVNTDLNSYLKDNNLTKKSLSVIGFSAGGNNAQSSYSDNLRFFGLIDPSTKEEWLNIKFGKNSHMIYNNSNWGSYPSIKSIQPKIASKIDNAGGKVESVAMSHANIPKYFFNSYANSI